MTKTRAELFEAGFQSRLEYVRYLWRIDEKLKALGEAARFPRLGDAKEAIERGWEASRNPDFYRAIGKDPEELVEAGLAALAERYDLPREES